ncbi:MAG TPA: RNA polymerase sigma factor [Rhodopila sp.]|uniref:RNA polymerase sigma factor n=1 Tax=Rhodopila sp. TaxID=2480087 RepID=UPI002C25B283|nr:RNA polymerase sigma factor [Rhodopila sp.]HVY18050.1 RNA polymerase sigma factor [Rhodopila sp.]
MTDMACLIEPMIPALRRYARGLLRDRAAADDLVQDCLERAITHWSRRRQDSDPRAWVFTILHNLAMTRVRRQASRPQPVDLAAVEDWVPVPPAQEDGLRYRALVQTLSQLPEDQRAVLLLVGIEDLSYAAAAEVLGIPIGTVMSRLSRARERLSRTIDRNDSSQPGQSPNHSPHHSPGQPLLRRVK